MASKINTTTENGLKLSSDKTGVLEFQIDGTTVASIDGGFLSSSLATNSININGSSAELGTVADMTQDWMDLQITNTGSNPIDVAANAVLPLTTRDSGGSLSNSSGTITVGRDGVYLVTATLLSYSLNAGYMNSGDGRIRLNGANIAAFYSGAKDWNNWEKSTGVAVFPAEVGDTITLNPVALSQWHHSAHSKVAIRRIGD